MENEILAIILCYSRKNKILSFDAINSIINIFIKHYGIENYYAETIFLDCSKANTSLAQYNKISHQIRIYFETIANYIRYKSHENFKTLDYIYMNLLITQSVLHELGHAFQEKLEAEVKDSLLKDILTYESLIFSCQSDEDYNKTYKLNPRERIAEILSNKEIGAIAESYDGLYGNLFYDEANKLLLFGYGNKREYPLKTYFKESGSDYIWDNLEYQFYASLLTKPRDYRMTLGLPILKGEYKSLILKSK